MCQTYTRLFYCFVTIAVQRTCIPYLESKFEVVLPEWRGPMPMLRSGFGGGRMAFAEMAAPNMRMAVRKGPAPAPMAAPGQMKKPKRVRKLFPETWMWTARNASWVMNACIQSSWHLCRLSPLHVGRVILKQNAWVLHISACNAACVGSIAWTHCGDGILNCTNILLSHVVVSFPWSTVCRMKQMLNHELAQHNCVCTNTT